MNTLISLELLYVAFSRKLPANIAERLYPVAVVFIRPHAMFYLFIYLRILLLICIDHIYLRHSLVFTCA